MSILDWFIDDPTMDPTEKLFMHGLQRYGQFETMERVGGALTDKILPDEDKELDREYKRLDIQTKKRMLGLPETSEDLDNSRNSNAPMWTVAAGHALQRIPEAGFMEGKNSLFPFFKTARSVPNDIPSIARRIGRAIR